jgi:hypothetical protein
MLAKLLSICLDTYHISQRICPSTSVSANTIFIYFLTLVCLFGNFNYHTNLYLHKSNTKGTLTNSTVTKNNEFDLNTP